MNKLEKSGWVKIDVPPEKIVGADEERVEEARNNQLYAYGDGPGRTIAIMDDFDDEYTTWIGYALFDPELIVVVVCYDPFNEFYDKEHGVFCVIGNDDVTLYYVKDGSFTNELIR